MQVAEGYHRRANNFSSTDFLFDEWTRRKRVCLYGDYGDRDIHDVINSPVIVAN